MVRSALIARTMIYTVLLVIVLGLVALGAFVWSGIYDIGADSRHSPAVHWALETIRDRSIAMRTDELAPPDLSERARIIQGSGNYDAMCAGCHLAPGTAETELSRGLYPSPPRLADHRVDPAKAFWVIKHGIKSTGMPAWGRSMQDPYIWNMAAFLQELPSLDAAAYRAMVAQSGGHSHGGGEAMGHDDATGALPPGHHGPGAAAAAAADHQHPPGTPDDHHAGAKAAEARTHRHADGTVESHPAPAQPSRPLTAPEPEPEPEPEPSEHDSTDHGH